MAKLELLLQAATKFTHADAVRRILGGNNPESVLISVAFVREAGVESLEESLRQVGTKTKIFVGIRNDITTVQGIKRLLALKVKLYAVDTGSRDTIFHPKLYLAVGKQTGGLIVGSANMTFQGLHNNIEASAVVSLDMGDSEDRKFIDDTEGLFLELEHQYPQHVFEIMNEKDADALFESGRLSDELIVLAPALVNRPGKGARDPLPRMKLHRVLRPRLRVPIRKGAAKVVVPGPALPKDEFYLVWASKPLEQRDLNIPEGPTTHITGSMSLDKGLLAGVDHRHFFYDEVFKGLKWAQKKKQPHLLVAQATFEIVIKDINYGKHILTLSHNTNTSSRSYQQNNAMTNLRWKPIKDLIRNRDLMGRTLSLYRKDAAPPEFLIEID